jgi:DNA polymerase III subunit delta'
MPHPPLVGHAAAREALGRAALAGTLPQSILLHGPAGIGKQRLGLWLAQVLVCDRPVPDAGACGACSNCRLAERLQHPDVQWFFPLPRPDGASADKLREKLEDLRIAELAARRADPLHLPQFDKPAAFYLAQVQSLQRMALSRPAMARRKVFVVGDAELMVPQESSPEAANAFLKLLEEPPPDTTLILTSSRPGALLPTVLSRVLPVRLNYLAQEEVVAFLEATGAVPATQAAALAAAAQGSVGRALRLRSTPDGTGPLARSRDEARAHLEAALSRSAVPRLAAAHAAAPAGARGGFVVVLDALGDWLRDLAALAAGADDRIVNGDAEEFLRRCLATQAVHPLGAARAMQRLVAARALAEGNVNPQLILSDLLRGLQADLGGGEA